MQANVFVFLPLSSFFHRKGTYFNGKRIRTRCVSFAPITLITAIFFCVEKTTIKGHSSMPAIRSKSAARVGTELFPSG